MNIIKIYGSNNCVYCLKLKNMLIENKIEHEFIYVDKPEGLEDFKKVFNKSGVDMIPQATVNGKLLVPNKSFTTIDEAFKLINELMEK